jgi:hypothetical protein
MGNGLTHRSPSLSGRRFHFDGRRITLNDFNRRRPQKGSSDLREKREQTKFDKWLEEKQRAVEKVNLILDPSPSRNELDPVEVLIVAVDRYMVCVEFQNLVTDNDGGTWWIQKSSIVGAAGA